MERAFFDKDHVAQQQLFFDLDDVRGYGNMQYADLPDAEIFNHIQQGADSYGRLSTSPDFVLYQQTQRPSVNPFQSQDHFQYGHLSPFLQSPHQSFQPGFAEDPCSARDFAAAWNSPFPSQLSPVHSFSSPVDIPARSHQGHNAFMSPTSTAEMSFLSHGSLNSSYTSMSRTESMPGSVASFDTAVEEPMQFPKQDIVRSDLGTSPFNLIEYRADDTTHRLAPTATLGGKRPRGRRGPLNHAQRLSTAHMRNVKACASCRARKAKCDVGIPCRQCINYYKANLIHHPCRGQSLSDIADKVLRGHIFPRKRLLGTDFGVNFRTLEHFTVYLSFGFGEPFVWSAQVASPYNNEIFARELRHEHVVYKWSGRHHTPSERATEKHWVFPALLTSPGGLKAAVDEHLGRMVDNPDYFARFPVFNSPLVVLKDIYKFYRKLGESFEEVGAIKYDRRPILTERQRPAKRMLGQAFKLLNLIHIGGDIRLSPNADSRHVLDRFFCPQIHESAVVPCFIRGQLGDVFSKLATEYMKEVLATLEMECLNKHCSHFPVIVSAFVLIFMAIESVQHKTQRAPFHAVQDGDASATPARPSSDDIDGMVDLLEFYKNCFANCHRDRLLSTVDADQLFPNISTSPSFRAGEQLVVQLREAIKRARPYLMDRSKESLVTSDVTIFFDRLVAKLLLLEA